MRNLLYVLFFALLFTACNADPLNPDSENTQWKGDWNSSNDPHYETYKGKYNPIAGKWILTRKNGKEVTDFLVYHFTNSRTFEVATEKPPVETEPNYSDKGTFYINDSQFKIRYDNTITLYKIEGTNENAVLTITEGKDVLTFKPYDSGAWYWKGDWNNPDDPHFAIYNGKYNPLLGTSKSTYVDGYPVTISTYYRFNADFTLEQSLNPDYSYSGKRSYWINDTGIKEDAWGSHPSYTSRYKIENNTLVLTGMLPNKGGILTLEKYK